MIIKPESHMRLWLYIFTNAIHTRSLIEDQLSIKELL